jgi:hypothetical protein
MIRATRARDTLEFKQEPVRQARPEYRVCIAAAKATGWPRRTGWRAREGKHHGVSRDACKLAGDGGEGAVAAGGDRDGGGEETV